MKHTCEVIERVFVASDEAAEVLKPGKEPFDFPAASIATKRPAILRTILASAPVWRNHLDSGFGKLVIQFFRVISFVTNQPLYGFSDEDFGQSFLDQNHFMWSSTFRANGDRKTVAVCHCHDLGPLAPLGFSDSRPLF